MKRIIGLLAALLLIGMLPVTALAEGESESPASPTPAQDELSQQNEPLGVTLGIDDKNVYQGMDKAYQDGYMPQVKDGVVTLVLPLVADGAIQGSVVTATPGLGDTASSPFVFKNYQKTVALAQNPVGDGSAAVASYLVRFDLPLAQGRVNGVYPVTVNIQAQGADGSVIQQAFTAFITVTDGKDPNATEPVKEEKPQSQPKIIVSSYSVNPSPVAAGDAFTLKVTLQNTSATKGVQNMTVTAACGAPGFALQNESDTFYISKLAKGATTELTLAYKTDLETPAQRYPISLAIVYDNADAMTLSSSGTVTVTVVQPLRVEMQAPTIAAQVNAGDTLPLSFQVMNLGRGMVYNVRVELDAPGLIPSGAAFIGNMQAGSAQTCDMDVFVGTKDMSEGYDGDEKYGFTSGTLTLVYEDEAGQEYTQSADISTTINAPVIDAEAGEPLEEPEKASQWWVSVAIGGALVAGLAAVLLYRRRRGANGHEDA